MSDETTRMTTRPGDRPLGRHGVQGGDQPAVVPPPTAPTRAVPPPPAPASVPQPRVTRQVAAPQDAYAGVAAGGDAAGAQVAGSQAAGAQTAGSRIPATGEVLGPFQLLASLGHGGFAHVYRAAGPGGEVALKVLTNSEAGSLDRFIGEAALLERLDGRGFPQFVAADLQGPAPWFAMELVPGPTLSQWVSSAGPMPVGDVLRVADDVLDALAVLQEEHFLHRDVKPANIIAAPERYVLLDLGIAKGHGTSTSTHAAGTISYMAPELFVRKPHARSDVYSLGLLLIFLATGSLPDDLNFAGRDLTAADVGPVDQRLLPLILAMTRHNPEDRPPLHNLSRTVAQLAADSARLDPALLAAAGATSIERGLVTDVLSGNVSATPAPTGVLANNPVQQGEPITNLVYDQQLMGRLHQVHADGFDGAAEEIISTYLAAVGPQRAGGRAPVEIKDYLWAAMRWAPAFTPEGYQDTFDGWVAYRKRHGLPLPGAPRTTSAVPRPAGASGAGAAAGAGMLAGGALAAGSLTAGSSAAGAMPAGQQQTAQQATGQQPPGQPTRRMTALSNQQATQVAPFRPGQAQVGTQPQPPVQPPPPVQSQPQPPGGPQPQPPAQPQPSSRREEREAARAAARDAAREDKRQGSDGGLRVVAAVIGWIPRILLAIAVYQLVRLLPGFDTMPSAAELPLFTALGAVGVSVLNLEPEWAPRLAELSIPLLGIVTSAVVNLVRAVRSRRNGRTWPFWLVVVVWVIVIAVQGVVAYAQDLSQDARESLQQKQEQIQDGIENGVQDTTEDVQDSLWESVENALPWN